MERSSLKTDLSRRSVYAETEDNKFMGHALELARNAGAAGEVPIGAVVICSEGTVIGRGSNQIEALGTQRAHAEMIALEQAAATRSDWRLSECWLYVTLEPCMMCLGLATISRVAGIVYGARSPLFGAHLDTDLPSPVYRNGSIRLFGGVRADEAAELLRNFFRKKRSKGE